MPNIPDQRAEDAPADAPLNFGATNRRFMTAPSGARIYYDARPPGLLGTGGGNADPDRSAIDHAQDLNDGIAGFHAGATLSRDWAKILAQAKQGAAPGAVDFTKQLGAAFDDDLARRRALHGQAGQDILADHAAALRNWLVDEAVQFEAQARGNKVRSDIEDAAELLAEAIRHAPGLYDHASNTLAAFAARLPADPSQQQRFLAQGLNRLAKEIRAEKIGLDYDEAQTGSGIEKTGGGFDQVLDGGSTSRHERDTLDAILDGLNKTEIPDPNGQSAGLFLGHYKALVKAGISPETARGIIVAAIPRTKELVADAQTAGDSSSRQPGIQPAFAWAVPLAQLALTAIFGVGATAIIANNTAKDRDGWNKWSEANDPDRIRMPPRPTIPGFPVPPGGKSDPLVTPNPAPKKPELPTEPPQIEPPNTTPGRDIDQPRLPKTWTEVLPALEEALTRPLVLESRRGGENNRKVSDIVAEECVAALEEILDPVYQVHHFAGATKRGKGKEELEEKAIKPKDAKGNNLYPTNKGAAFPDISIAIKKGEDPLQEIHINVADFVGGKNFTKREREAFAKLEDLLAGAGDKVARIIPKYNLEKHPEREPELRQEAREICKDAIKENIDIVSRAE